MSTFATAQSVDALYGADLGIRFHINSKRRAYTVYTKLTAATDASDGAEFYDARPEVRNAAESFLIHRRLYDRESTRRPQYPSRGFIPPRSSRIFRALALSLSHHSYVSIRCLSTSIANTPN